MRLKRIQTELKKRGWNYTYTEESGCGSLDFEYRGVGYHIWEFEDQVWGAETNVRSGGKSEDILGDYEGAILQMLEQWE